MRTLAQINSAIAIQEFKLLIVKAYNSAYKKPETEEDIKSLQHDLDNLKQIQILLIRSEATKRKLHAKQIKM